MADSWTVNYLRNLPRAGKDGAIISFPMLDRLLAEHAALREVARAAKLALDDAKHNGSAEFSDCVAERLEAPLAALEAVHPGVLDKEG